MTIKEKAKAYDKALEIAKAWHKLDNNDLSNDDLETLFPELKESDERIRKGIIRCVIGNMPDNDIRKKYIAWLEKQSNSIDKVEPKFKVGDWITNSVCTIQITSIDDRYYWHDNDCVGGDIESIDREYHLWTIQDAKDGDVLVDEDNDIGIYKEIEGICWHSYIYLGCDNCLYGFNIGGSHKQNSTKPATKEQRDNLFKKINEEGYVWYPNSKELYKLIRINYD